MAHMCYQEFQLKIDILSWEEAHHNLNVLAAVDLDLRFIYMIADCERSAHDALILVDALQRPDVIKVPQDNRQ
jgi:hypothetical protein